MKTLVVDNYDSFTYNLVQYMGEVDSRPEVHRNDEITVDEVAELGPQAIVISPGPGRPPDAGISCDLIRRLGKSIPILGVCLGLQCIASEFGGGVVRADEIYHGKTSPVFHANTPLYNGVENPFVATRYHSLEVSQDSLPRELSVDALTENGEIMGLHHDRLPLLGVQFHPESVLTDSGKDIIRNFLSFASSPEKLGKTGPEAIDLSTGSED